MKKSMHISGHTVPFAVLGHPIGHTLSPVMHNAGIHALSMDAIYLAFDVHPDRLMPVLASMREMGFGGVNLTVPLKEVAFRGIDDLDATARLLGAVNTVEFLKDGTLRGHNTDGDGFVLAVQEAFGETLEDQRIFVLGAGGAGRAIAIRSAMEKAAHIQISDVDVQRAEGVVNEIRSALPRANVTSVTHGEEQWIDASRASDLVVHATPVGMNSGDASLLPSSAFRPAQMVLDLIYMQPQTPITRTADEAGARAANGLGMLLHQGAYSFHIWTGVNADVKAMRHALEEAVYGSVIS